MTQIPKSRSTASNASTTSLPGASNNIPSMTNTNSVADDQSQIERDDEVAQLLDNEEWEKELASVELQDRREARLHIERLLPMPECVPLALQCELERIKANVRTVEIRRENRAKLQEVTGWSSERKVASDKGLLCLSNVISVTSLVLSAGLAWFTWRSVSRSLSAQLELMEDLVVAAQQTQQAQRPAAQPPVAPSPVPQPAPPPPAPVPPPTYTPLARPTTSAPGTRVSCTTTVSDDNVRYVIVKQKVC